MSYFKMQRGWQDSDCFGNEPYSDRDAWVWMVGEAEWKDRTINVLGKPVSLKRGQFSSSVRFMAKKFTWSTNRVLRFLKRLQRWSMVETETNTGQFIITICNYSKYQNKETQSDTPSETRTETGAETHPETNTKNTKKEKNKRNKRAAVAAVKPESVSQRVWDDFNSQRKNVFTVTALEGIEREAQKAGWVLEDALRYSVVRGWQSFDASWIKENGNGKRNGKYTANDALGEIINEIRADSPSGAPELCDTGHLRQITGRTENPDAGNDRGPQ